MATILRVACICILFALTAYMAGCASTGDPSDNAAAASLRAAHVPDPGVPTENPY